MFVFVFQQFQYVGRLVCRRLVDDDDLIARLILLFEEGGQLLFQFASLVVDSDDD